MAQQMQRTATILALAGVLWIASLVPLPGVLGYLDPARPTILSIAFALLGKRLGVASWPLVVTFSLTFFLYSVVAFYFSPDAQGLNDLTVDNGSRAVMTYFGAMIFAPITLWCPILFACGAYALVGRKTR